MVCSRMQEGHTFFLYVLELTDGFFYVGSTENPVRRIREHKEGKATPWTSIHIPLEYPEAKYRRRRIVCSKEMCRLEEDKRVKEIMLSEGIDKVRGGSYSEVTFPNGSLKFLKRELCHASDTCFSCGKHGHYMKECPKNRRVSDVSDSQSESDEDYYLRTGKSPKRAYTVQGKGAFRKECWPIRPSL